MKIIIRGEEEIHSRRYKQDGFPELHFEIHRFHEGRSERHLNLNQTTINQISTRPVHLGMTHYTFYLMDEAFCG
jgi:hypothetical protein